MNLMNKEIATLDLSHTLTHSSAPSIVSPIYAPGQEPGQLTKRGGNRVGRRDSDGEGHEFEMVEYHKQSDSPVSDEQTARSMMALTSEPTRDSNRSGYAQASSPTNSGALSSPSDRQDCGLRPPCALRPSNSIIRDDGVVAVDLEEDSDDEDYYDEFMNDEQQPQQQQQQQQTTLEYSDRLCPRRADISPRGSSPTGPIRSLKFESLLSKFQNNVDGKSKGSSIFTNSQNATDDPMSWLEMSDPKDAMRDFKSSRSTVMSFQTSR